MDCYYDCKYKNPLKNLLLQRSTHPMLPDFRRQPRRTKKDKKLLGKNSKTVSHFYLNNNRPSSLGERGRKGRVNPGTTKSCGKTSLSCTKSCEMTSLSLTVPLFLSLIIGMGEFALLSLPLTSFVYKDFAQHTDP